ncbi:hypothetical protein MIND_00804300 [Mycena indigotica]|uniref:Uncharacterized protein n=1 Tax=Mycena indigotica TaxID=2126181 RepID=A0A8H6W0I8_9AGAR|nr:uncharacterized protein MIND_00804300 [Mycena indigotica]KAF7298576.1 hypothetical protein MIND_00804300 [Mycena indigotica]
MAQLWGSPLPQCSIAVLQPVFGRWERNSRSGPMRLLSSFFAAGTHFIGFYQPWMSATGKLTMLLETCDEDSSACGWERRGARNLAEHAALYSAATCASSPRAHPLRLPDLLLAPPFSFLLFPPLRGLSCPGSTVQYHDSRLGSLVAEVERERSWKNWLKDARKGVSSAA